MPIISPTIRLTTTDQLWSACLCSTSPQSSARPFLYFFLVWFVIRFMGTVWPGQPLLFSTLQYWIFYVRICYDAKYTRTTVRVSDQKAFLWRESRNHTTSRMNQSQLLFSSNISRRYATCCWNGKWSNLLRDQSQRASVVLLMRNKYRTTRLWESGWITVMTTNDTHLAATQCQEYITRIVWAKFFCIVEIVFRCYTMMSYDRMFENTQLHLKLFKHVCLTYMFYTLWANSRTL